VDINILKLAQIIGWFKNEASTLQVGLYDVAPMDGLPVSGQWPANDAELGIWKRANSYLIPFVLRLIAPGSGSKCSLCSDSHGDASAEADGQPVTT
jgi:hypothetical protein